MDKQVMQTSTSKCAEFNLLREKAADLTKLCRNPVRGHCHDCPSRNSCEETVTTHVDRLFNMAHEFAMECRKFTKAQIKHASGGKSHELVACEKLLDALSIVVMDCGRIKPIKLIDSSLTCIETYAYRSDSLSV
jgi:hypothetical protein